MDVETLTNTISGLGKHPFESACKLVLTEIFGLRVVNVDGKGDGGTDFSAFDGNGQRSLAAYQITTQKTDIKKKAYRDATKSVEKLGVTQFFYLTSFVLSEVETRKIEREITAELGIPSTCYSSKTIAGLLLSENLLNRFLDETNQPLPRDYSPNSPDYREMALHSYTLSNDAKDMKDGIYDDTVLLIVSENPRITQDEILGKVKTLLVLDDLRDDVLIRRIGALFGKEKLKRDENQKIVLSERSKNDVEQRKKIYNLEMSNMVAAQIDILQDKCQISWSVDDSKKVAVWIAEAYINDQISKLKDIKASIVSHPLFNIEGDGLTKVKSFLVTNKGIDKELADDLVNEFVALASNHPLISKISKASVYLALEGGSPISKAKALGASRWSDFNMMLEPSVAIPYICSCLYRGEVNRSFDMSIRAIDRAKKLSVRLGMPFFYINECAGHLLQARKYDGIEFDEKELQYSGNAYVSNYYALKLRGVDVPLTFMEYLATFSPEIRTEQSNAKTWVRSLMTGIQSLLTRSGVEFIEVPQYTHEDCIVFEKEYSYRIEEYKLDKPINLINNDIWALQFTNDQNVKNGEHWIVLTYDKSLISFGKIDSYNGWIANPPTFLNLTETFKPLSETQFISLLHSVATFSEKTLSVGARIMDKIVAYASKEMQDWKFKQEYEKFKKEAVSSIDVNSRNPYEEIDKKVEEFLKKQGIDLKTEDLSELSTPLG
jgi:hypothetical protein